MVRTQSSGLVSRGVALFVLGWCGLWLQGCTSASPIAAKPSTRLRLAGTVHGGQQPVFGATIELYAVGSGTDGAVSEPLLISPVMTDMGGNFSISLDYQCPTSPTPEVYLTASGGNPGLSEGTKNMALAMMAALGPCDQLGTSTFISMNEVTTVGSLAALYPYATGYASIGASNVSALKTAFDTVNEYVNIKTGSAPGPMLPAGYYASSTEINTLADAISTCINSSGGVARDGTACGRLLEAATPPAGVAPTDTVRAVINILKNPTQNVSQIFDQQPGIGAPFQPSLPRAPVDWTLPIVQVPAVPTISPAGGSFVGSVSVTLSDTNNGATMYYTTDGTTPTTLSNVYGGPITVSGSETITAIASTGRASSAAASANFTITPPPPEVTSVTPSGLGTPHSVAVLGSYIYVSVQGTGQIFTYQLSSGNLVQAGSPYLTPCSDPSGMVGTTINAVDVMAVVCFDTNSLLTLTRNGDGSLSALGSVSGLASPFFGIALDGTNVYVPLFGASGSSNGSVARVSLATPSAPVITGLVTLASPGSGEFANPDYMVLANGALFVTGGSESAPQSTSSTIQVVDEASMTLLGTPFLVAHSPQQMTVSGNTMYVTFYDAEELQTFDISSPAALRSLQVLSLDCAAIPVILEGTKAFVGCYGQSSVDVVDVTSPSAMSLSKTIPSIVRPEGMAVVGPYVVVAGGAEGGSVYAIDSTQ